MRVTIGRDGLAFDAAAIADDAMDAKIVASAVPRS